MKSSESDDEAAILGPTGSHFGSDGWMNFDVGCVRGGAGPFDKTVGNFNETPTPRQSP